MRNTTCRALLRCNLHVELAVGIAHDSVVNGSTFSWHTDEDEAVLLIWSVVSLYVEHLICIHFAYPHAPCIHV